MAFWRPARFRTEIESRGSRSIIMPSLTVRSGRPAGRSVAGRAAALLALAALALTSPGADTKTAAQPAPPGGRPEPPMTRVESVADDLHGVAVPDPYRWLENGGSDEVRRWVEAQNRYTRSFLEARPGRA